MARGATIPDAGRPANRGRDAWLVAAYKPVTLFSLRMTHATSKGGKTLVVPTPYAIKMALLDACFRRFPASEAETQARHIFDLVKGRDVRVCPPTHCIVNNTFVKVLDWDREAAGGPFRSTIVYREFASFHGDDMRVGLAIAGLADPDRETLAELFAHINSLGKRGGFLQFAGSQVLDGELPFGFTVVREEASLNQIASYAMTHALDDFGEALCVAKDGFDRVSTYGGGTIRLGEHRVLATTAIPYSRRAASRHFTWYQRVNLPKEG